MDLILATTTPAALAAKKVTSTIPIVITAAFDPVGAGLASSLAKPGGNVTGLGLLVPEISAKALALFKEAVHEGSPHSGLMEPGQPRERVHLEGIRTRCTCDGVSTAIAASARAQGR